MEADLVLDAVPEKLAVLRSFIRENLTTAGYSDTIIDAVVLTVDEAASNIMEHGYRRQAGAISVNITTDASGITVRMRDEAALFDPTQVPYTDLDVPIEQRAKGGLGIFLMRSMMDEVSYQVTTDGHNQLTLFKRCQPASP